MSGRHEVKIGDNSFYIRRYNPFMALEILGDLQKQFAGPFLGVLDGKAAGTEGEGQAAMMAAFSKLSATIDGKTLRTLAKRLLDPDYISVSIDGAEPKKLDEITVGLAITSVGDLLQLCWEVISYNFAEVVARIASPTGPAGRFLKQNPSENSVPNSSVN